MKVRIGIGLGGERSPEALVSATSAMAAHGFDSLWLPEVLSRPGFDPLLGLAWAGALHPRLKLGTTMLLPGRNPVRTARQLATLDVLTGGRFLVTFVPGITQGPERHAVGVPVRERGEAIERALPHVRRLLEGEEVDGVTIAPLPVQKVFSIWLGGLAPASLDRCGRLADGWLPSFVTPQEAAAGKAVIDRAAEGAGREIDPEHFGVSIRYGRGELTDEQRATLSARARGNALEDVMPVGLPALRSLLERHVEVGFSKFVVRPDGPVDDWDEELGRLRDAVGDLQT
jgi:probable F420-dependent oxidoreductase